MTDEPSQALSIEVSGGGSRFRVADDSRRAHAAYVFAHGAGAGMRHPFMAAVASGLAARGVATLRFQFPSMERGVAPARPAARRPRRGARRRRRGERAAAGLPLFAGGKSFGGRMTSQAQAGAPLPGVRGLVFLGFPLHPAGRPGVERGEHLDRVDCPMLFLQGTRDELADAASSRALIDRLGAGATLAMIDDADHAFHVRRAERQRRRRGDRAHRRHDARLDGALGAALRA